MGSRLGEVRRTLKLFVLFVLVPFFLAPSCKPAASSTLDLSAPLSLTAVAVSTTQIGLAWVNIARGAVTLEVERSVNGGPFTLLVTLPASQSATSDAGLAPSTEYCYQIRVVNGTKAGPFTTPPACASTVVVSPLVPTPDPIAGAPGARMGHSAIYDPVGNRMIVFGGLLAGAPASVTDDLWVLDLTLNSWALVPTAGLWPAPRMGHSAILDTTYNRMVIFGGYDGTPGNEVDELWSFDLDPASLTPLTWSLLSTPGGPLARQGHTAIFDPLSQMMIVIGGMDVSTTYGDVWSMTLPAPPSSSNPSLWTDISPVVPGPAARSGHSAVYDPAVQQVIIFGGRDVYLGGTPSYPDAWQLSLTGTPAWSQVSASAGPTARFGHSAVLNGAKMMVFGGYTGVATGEMWQLNLGATPTWAPVTLGAVAPGARLGHSSVFRASTTTMILFGGGTAPATFAPPTSPGTAAFNDVWQFGM